MYRFLVPAAAVILAGCATQQAPVLQGDSIDALIAKSAQNATKALRNLSEATGNSRLVETAPKAPVAAPQQQELREPQPQQSVGAANGSIAVEKIDAPAVVASPSSGVVASGGLLSVPPAGLERLITVRWTGELEDLIARIAQECGWTVAAPSGFRVSPVVISISAENRSAFDVLRDIGAIAGTSAEIVVSAPTRSMAVRYPNR